MLKLINNKKIKKIKPRINVYIYDIVNIKLSKENKTLSKLKFGNLYINKDESSFISPIEQTIMTRNNKKQELVNDSNNYFYSKDILSSMDSKYGTSNKKNKKKFIILNNIIQDIQIKKYYDFYKSHYVKEKLEDFKNNKYFELYINDKPLDQLSQKEILIKKFKKIITNATSILTQHVNRYSDTFIKENMNKIVVNNIFKKNNHYNKLYNGSLIYNMKIKDNEKLIMLGDIHGSFHTFFRILVRFHLFGAINLNTYKINDGYKLIFLGDIFDRGTYVFEIMYIVLRFFINNNTKNDLKIIINRGNHEENETYTGFEHGFYKEMTKKFGKDVDQIMGLFDNFYIFSPSGIVLNHNNKKYFISHGGLPINFNKKELSFDIPDGIKNKIIFSDIYNNKESHFYKRSIVRWGEYSVNDKLSKEYVYPEIDYLQKEFPDTKPRIPLTTLNNFLFNKKFDFIIRGHTDNVYNAALLNKNAELIPLNKIDKNKLYKKMDYINPQKIKIIKIIKKNNSKKSKYADPSNIQNSLHYVSGPVSTIYPDEWQKNKNKNNNSNSNRVINLLNNNVYPVLTISTNSDNYRMLNKDSFIVFNFSNKKDFIKYSNLKNT